MRYPSTFPELADYQFQGAWRAAEWSLDARLTQLLDTREHLSFHMGVFSALRDLQAGTAASFWTGLRRGRLEAVATLSEIDVESSRELFPTLARMQFFTDIERAWLLRFASDADRMLVRAGSSGAAAVPVAVTALTCEQVRPLEVLWQQREQLMATASFDVQEPLMALHSVLFCVLAQPAAAAAQLSRLAELARKVKRTQIAMNTIHQLKATEPAPMWALSEAKILWSQGEHAKALKHMQSLCTSLPSGALLADALRCCGKWLAHTTSAPSRSIIDQYFQPAIRQCAARSPQLAKGLLTLASCITITINLHTCIFHSHVYIPLNLTAASGR